MTLTRAGAGGQDNGLETRFKKNLARRSPGAGMAGGLA